MKKILFYAGVVVPVTVLAVAGGVVIATLGFITDELGGLSGPKNVDRTKGGTSRQGDSA